ncbi:hypothetical protein AGOR_G00064980 [Albula goreensis]|uniref:Poly [ADP-ribose] polymerase n=1 Tax=Albula goreensis TaxID=1534307 RepID=A0A8T3DRN8_9TELE|nr:hypothetical protein AGOR_G00064980 [Albula goreensis]
MHYLQATTIVLAVMPVFENCSVVLDSKDLPFKEKKKLKLAITDNGGRISYVVNEQCTHVITNNLSSVSSNRQRSIQKFQVPVSVQICPRRSGTHFPSFPKLQDLCHSVGLQVFKETGQPSVGQKPINEPPLPAPTSPQGETDMETESEEETREGTYLGKLRVYSENDSDLPMYPSDFEVAKYSIFERVSPSVNWSVLELQSSSGPTGRQYRVVRHWSEGQGAEASVTRDKLVHCSSSEEALEVYETLKTELHVCNFKLQTALPPLTQGLGSSMLHQLLLEERMNSSAISETEGAFVELLWREALGCLNNILKIPITGISLNDVSKAEGLLLQVQKGLKDEREQNQLQELMREFYTLLPHKEETHPTTRTISQKLDLCQLIRDMLKVSEATLWSPTPSSLGKYRALGCSIECVSPGSQEYRNVTYMLVRQRPVQIKNVFRVSRPVEMQTFQRELGNVKPLMHSSAPRNFVGILSRGLLLPKVGVEHHGIERTDIGHLGSGIYFSDSPSTGLNYAKPGQTDGTRLLAVCDVALGQCKDLHKRDVSLTCAPEGYHSVCGVREYPGKPSDFKYNEYVVYNADQVQIKYVVQFTVEGDTEKKFQPTVNVSSDEKKPASASDLLAEGEEDSVDRYKNRLEEVTAGLLDNTGKPLPLQAVHVKCKLMDLLTQVIIFQSYTNLSQIPIEAKYVFPLDESAAVCGFEAFINGKHIVGQVKEKGQARKEYRQAIEKGHGAYLMDQDAPDVFTISVGNLPPGATVLIKVTYVSELVVRAGSLVFSLPGSVAPWQQSKALNQRTQVSVEKVRVNEVQTERLFTLDMSIEMPYEILDLSCVTHQVKIKKTDCKAVVSTLPGQTLGSDGFQLSFTLSKVHLPRMWVENHPDKDSQACMLVFYPHFDPSSRAGPGDVGGAGGGVLEVVILLDTSESMRGVAMQDARRIVVQVLKSLEREVKVNIISFGTGHKELFLSSQSCNMALQPAIKFAMTSPPVGGSTEMWRPLRTLSLLPPSRGTRNLLLISDGHIQNEAVTLRMVRENIQHSRMFTCGVSPTANQHILRALAQAGGGAYEFFDTKRKHTWVGKVSSQVRRMACPGCSSVSVKWQQFDSTAAPLVQAPAQLHGLFSDCQTLIYGFVPHCTQATLSGKLSEQEIETMVSTTELQKTKGTFLHKLTARAVIRDYEDGSLHADKAEHEGKKEELKAYIIELSKEYSIVTQYTSFVAIEERDSERPDVGFTDIPKLVAEEDVDFLPYISWEEEKQMDEDVYDAVEENCGLPATFGMEDTLDFLGLDEEDSLGSAAVSSRWGIHRAVRSARVMGPKAPTSKPAAAPLPAKLRLSETLLAGDAETAHKHKKGSQVKAQSGGFPHYEAMFSSLSHLTLESPRTSSGFQVTPLSTSKPGIFGSSGTSFGFSGGVIPSRCFSFGSPAQSSGYSDVTFGSVNASSFGSSPAYSHFSFGSSGDVWSGFGSESISVDAFQQQERAVTGLGSSDFGVPPRDLTPTSRILESLHSPPPSRPPPSLFKAPLSEPLPAHETQKPQQGAALKHFHRSSRRCSARVPSVLPAVPAPPPPPPPPNMSAALRPPRFAPTNVSPPSLFQASLSEPLPANETQKPQQGAAFHSFLQHIHRSRFQSSARIPSVLPAVPAPPPPLPPNRSAARRLSRCSLKGRRSDMVPWAELFDLQHQDGYWECTERLGSILKLDIDFFANVFLKEKGILSLGVRAHADILRLLATLLVLQLTRVKGLPEGSLLKTLFHLKDTNLPMSLRGEAVKKAVEWVMRTDRQYPCVCSRLEFGRDWESATRQLLRADPLPPHSPLHRVLERSTQI